MYFREALQNTPEFVFKKYAEGSTSEIHEYIEPFFSTVEQGLHILIVCLPSDAQRPDDNIIQKALSHDNDPCLPLPPQHEEITHLDCSKRFFVVSPMLNDYTEVLGTLSEYYKRCYNKADPFSTIIRVTKKDALMSNIVAGQLQCMLQDTFNSVTVKHTLFAILLLPESFFEEVKTPETCFPCFFEYIVLGIGVRGAIKDLKEQLIQKDQDNQQLKAENTIIREKLTKRDDYIIMLTTSLLSVLKEGILTGDMNNSLKEIFDRMKKRDDWPSEIRDLIVEAEPYLNKNIKTKTY